MEDLLSIKPKEVAESVSLSMYPKDHEKLIKFCDFLSKKNNGMKVSEEDVVKRLLMTLDEIQEFSRFTDPVKKGRKKKTELS